MIEAVGTLHTRLERDTVVRLAMRLGIHTGMVVVGEMGGGGRQEHLALGETPNIAARLQALAAPDTVVVSAATFRLVQGYFTAEELGTHTLRGVAAPVPVYRMLAARGVQSRLDAIAPTRLTPLVGREEEVALVHRRWDQTTTGLGQVVLLRGEAGIGKSRLVEVLRERVGREGGAQIICRCSPYHTNSTLYPVIEHLQQLLQWQRDDPPSVKVDKLEQTLRPYRLALEDVVPLFAALLSVPLPDRYPPLNLPPQKQRRQTQAALMAWLLEQAERQPVLAVYEDLHWADPTTLELLGLVIHQTPAARMLTLLTCRPEFQPPWAMRVPLTQIPLGRLSRAQVAQMVGQLTSGKAFPAEMVEQVIAKTHGVPLFVEEIVKMILESGLVREEAGGYVLDGPLPPLAIPSTLHDSLMGRLDRLGGARALAQLASVLGREFSYEVLQAVAQVDEPTLQHGLAQLVDAELLYQRGLPPQARYLFKHALIQDTAYQSLLKSTRQHYHQRIAQVLEARFPENVESQPELLAQHYSEAELHAQAVDYWQQAGQRASEGSAYVEAIEHLTKGLEVLTRLPSASERAGRELLLQLTLGATLMATKGYTVPEVGQAYTRARVLCQQVEQTSHLAAAVYGLA